MIETLRIEGLAIVDRAEIEFGPGLNVLTGETGAGKSIVLGALALLSGARGAAGSVREGSEAAVVEAVFSTRGLAEIERELGALGIETEGHELVAHRTLAAGGGRSRARLGGQLVPVAKLTDVFAGRIEISSQHDSQALRRPEVHGLLLDRVGGLLPVRERVAQDFARVRALDEEAARLRAEASARAQRRDFLAFQVREIDEARLDAEEAVELRRERSRLAHAGRLGGDGGAALARLTGDPEGGGAPAAADLLAEAARLLEGLETLDSELAPLAGRLAAAQAELRDAALELERYLAGIEGDPGRLAALEERLHAIEQLQRKYGGSVEAVLRFRETAAEELEGVEGAGEREAAIGRERAECVEALARDAAELSKGRARAGRRLQKRVLASLVALSMPQARFAVALDLASAPEGLPCGASGAEVPEFRFSANEGEALRPLRRVASGGELSRLFLALKNASREADAGMVLVFDEVDAGVGGRTADRVGRALAELAAHHQVLCITHLPQVAALAETHFRVEKRTQRGRTVARIARIEGADRIEEIARMAGGAAVGEATRRHARELLGPRATP